MLGPDEFLLNVILMNFILNIKIGYMLSSTHATNERKHIVSYRVNSFPCSCGCRARGQRLHVHVFVACAHVGANVSLCVCAFHSAD